MSLLAAFPAPPAGSLQLGPLKLNAYGLMIALGVVAAVWLTGRRAEARGVATRDDVGSIALVAVPVGVVGARLYHVITDWDRFSGNLALIPQVWKGGLGIWGGIALGTIAGLLVARRRGLPIAPLLTCVAPALPLAQAIGRWGNWFNEELFGRPTTLPWALEVSDTAARRAGFEPGLTFHPTFLYESLACLAIAGGLVLLDARRPMRDGRLFALYVAAYTAVRFLVEGLRVDRAREFGGLRLNQWVAAAVFVVAVVVVARMRGSRTTGSPVASEA